MNRLDISLNLILATNLHKSIIDHHLLQSILDTGWLGINVLFGLSVRKQSPYQAVIAITTCLYNWVYALMLSLFTTLSIEGFAAWVLIPLIFSGRSLKNFYYLLHVMRYTFLLIFFSAALWKFRAGGIFNKEQMSAILIKQHAAYLYFATKEWYAHFLLFFINNKLLSYIIYIMAAVCEALFCIGFFTKKYDRHLIIIFFIFLIMDYLFMRINYFSWLAFAGCLWFSGLMEPGESNINLKPEYA